MSIMLFVVVITHGLIYLLAPRMQLAVSTLDDVVLSIRQEQFVTEAVEKALPVSLSCSLLISLICSLLFSKMIADPVKKISACCPPLSIWNGKRIPSVLWSGPRWTFCGRRPMS